MQMFADLAPTEALNGAGFRFGGKGTHTSRTIMLEALVELMDALPSEADREEYRHAIEDENLLGKPTYNTRVVTRRYLAQLYGLDPGLGLFRVLRRLWRIDLSGRPLLAMLCALARDPLLRLTAEPVLSLSPGEELLHESHLAWIEGAVGSRLNRTTADAVARRSAASWTQSGHLEGRRTRLRRRVVPTPGAVAMALWMGQLAGQAGLTLLDSDWNAVLEKKGADLIPLALEAKRLGLIQVRVAGDVVEIDTGGLDPEAGR